MTEETNELKHVAASDEQGTKRDAAPLREQSVSLEAASASGSEKSAGSVDSILMWLVRDGPSWARVPAVTVTLLMALAGPLQFAWSALNASHITEGKITDSKQVAGVQLDMASATQNQKDEAEVKSFFQGNPTPEQLKRAQEKFSLLQHQLSHFANPKDNVPWVVFAKKSTSDYFGYKIFPSDNCLLIARIENGSATAQWLSDPNHPLDVPSTPVANPPKQPPPAPTPTGSDQQEVSSRLRLIEAALTEDIVIPEERRGKSDLVSRVSGLPANGAAGGFQGTCLNPHPGRFVATPGSFINECEQTIFLRWADGCAAVQVYNRCANVYGPVVWQACMINHGY